MTSNVYTKNEILQSLASKGYFIDTYTLDTFFEKWKVEAIFEDEQGSEFYDKNALDLVLKNLFSAENEPEKKDNNKTETQTTEEKIQETSSPEENIVKKNEDINIQEEKLNIDDQETVNILNNISLSDGTPLIEKVQENINFNTNVEQQQTAPQIEPAIQKEEEKSNENKPGILEGAMQATGIDFNLPQTNEAQLFPPSDESGDFDDISLLSESLEAQEKFRQYVVSELVKKNVDLNPKNNEFKLDISERTINMIARTMAKKIAKHVNTIFSADAKSATQLENVKEENKKLTQKARELEEQNKKLRLLLAESNKNLNSYKPSIFGLYKKVDPNK